MSGEEDREMRSGDGGRRSKRTSRRRVTEADEDLVVRIVRQTDSTAQQSRAEPCPSVERFQQSAQVGEEAAQEEEESEERSVREPIVKRGRGMGKRDASEEKWQRQQQHYAAVCDGPAWERLSEHVSIEEDVFIGGRQHRLAEHSAVCVTGALAIQDRARKQAP
ncbi:hypothetical protein CKAH01_01449 [Colletotrichum kahawae]|uniref:Uncharacterized protein n=1 Tax=Colletotrichum kahawae TaxID=34407 RepID=A0AAD9Y7A8_COLKA|nr:hypothetical protein CKAH01_01449 [Colletotrichum kahawae]